MEKIQFDSGVKEYEINDNGVLRFNPSDPNVYARFFDAKEQILAIETELVTNGKNIENSENAGKEAIFLIKDADAKVKDILNHVFGEGNDFDKMLSGVNLMAVGSNGERVITNLLNALVPIVEQGAKTCVNGQVNDAVSQARANRAARMKKK